MERLKGVVKPFFIVSAGFILGIGVRSLFEISFYAGVFIFLLGLLLFLYLKIFRGGFGFSIPIALSIGILFFGLGVLRYDLGDKDPPIELEQKVNSEVVLSGVIVREPDIREKVSLLTIKINDLDVLVLVTSDVYPKYKYGDLVSFEGKLEKPESFVGNNGKIVNYESYLNKEGVYYTLFKPKIILASSSNGNLVIEKLLFLKEKFLLSIKSVIPAPESALLGGILLGTKEALGESLQEIFRRAGIIHIVVLSGYNITIVAEAIMRLLSFASLRARLFVGGISITLFALMVGPSATVVRASVMAIFVLLSRAVKRKYVIGRALMITGLIMVLHNPKILIFDLSFQLSFLATIGLIYLAPLIEKYFSFVPTKFELREFGVATISTQVLVLPLLLFSTGEASVVALVVNLLVLVFVPITMLLGFVTGVLGLISPSLALPIGYVTFLILKYELSVSEFFGNLSFASFGVSNFNAPHLIISYFVVFSVIFYSYSRRFKNS